MKSAELLKDLQGNYETIEQDLDKLDKIKTIIEDYEKYKLKPYKPADDYIRLIKEVLNNE